MCAAIAVMLAGAIIAWLDVGSAAPQAAAHHPRLTPRASPAAGQRPTAQVTAPGGETTGPSPVPSVASDPAYLAVLPHGTPTFTASFSGTQLDASIWGTCYPESNPVVGCTNFGNADEYEWYLSSQDQVSGGVLRLIAQQEQTAGLAQDGSSETYGCRSGMVTTYPGFQFRYGFLQVVAKIPHAPGLWSALWLAAANLQWPPEVDMIENWGIDHESASFYHLYPTGYIEDLVPESLTSDWQTFSVYWTPAELEIFIGTTLILTDTSSVPQQEMYFIADLAEYEPPAQGNCAGELDIQSLKYWESS
jgi:Glycosyl hydrolases family 16